MADAIFRCIFVTQNVCSSNKNPLKYVAYGPVDNELALIRHDKPFSEPMSTKISGVCHKHFDSNFIDVCSLGSHWQQINIDCILWTYDDQLIPEAILHVTG